MTDEERYYLALAATPEAWSALTDELTADVIESDGFSSASVVGEIDTNNSESNWHVGLCSRKEYEEAEKFDLREKDRRRVEVE